MNNSKTCTNVQQQQAITELAENFLKTYSADEFEQTFWDIIESLHYSSDFDARLNHNRFKVMNLYRNSSKFFEKLSNLLTLKN